MRPQSIVLTICLFLGTPAISLADVCDTVVCDDNNSCTDDSCDPATGTCIYTPDDTNGCTDGDACHGPDHCLGGVCLSGPSISCDDGNPCTDNNCNPASGCFNPPNDSNSCSDGNACFGPDRCVGGVCLPGPSVNCDDGNPCTDNGCDPASGCFYPPNDGNTCSDGDLCSRPDFCAGGQCHGGPRVVCADSNPCTDDYCDFVTGECRFQNVPSRVCRPSNGLCDVAETCTEMGAMGPGCPPDAFAPATTVCRTSQGGCDPAELCTGAGPDCPVDVSGTCCEATNPRVLCSTHPLGSYTLTFLVTNNSGVPASYLLLPASQTTPHIFPLNPPLPSGGTRTVTIQVNGIVPAHGYCFDAALADASGNQCCPLQVCADFPLCDCLEVPAFQVQCVNSNTVSLGFNVTNLTQNPSVTVEHLFLFPPPGTGVGINPNYFDLPTLPYLQTTSVGPASLTGVIPGTDVCLRISIHEESVVECCSDVRCFPIPDCGGLSGLRSTALRVGKSGVGDLLTWPPIPGATGYDVVAGDLAGLRATNGNFVAATETCLMNDGPDTSLFVQGIPARLTGTWYLMRGVVNGAGGTYDEGVSSQVDARDDEIAASGDDCP